MKLKEIIKQLIFSADSYSYRGIEEKKKSILLNLFFNFYFLVILGFLIYNIVIADTFYLMVTAGGMLCGLLLYYFFHVKQILYPVAGIFVVTITVLVTLLILAGGVNDTALIFSLLIPVPAILLLGKRNGLGVLGVFFVLNTLAFILFNGRPWFPDYDIHLVSRTAIVFVLISLTAYANEYVFGVLYQGLEKLSESLKTSLQRYKTLAVNKEKFVSLVSHSLGDHIGKFADMATLLHDEYHGLSEPKRRQLIKKLANISRQNQKTTVRPAEMGNRTERYHSFFTQAN